ncbi:hypothetical protein HSX11_14460 [Oxalobacteraceae bacterium]|nr:hypothetical protein [Oxalobacteraceae bacterium]
MNEVSLFRLYVLRAMYLLIVVGLGIVLWPGIIHPSHPWALKEGVVICMLGAFSALCVLGLRYPLQMLPVLMWELLWKGMWLSLVALPLWRADQLDGATMTTAIDCLVVVIVPFVIPWGYVAKHYFKKPGERWRAQDAGHDGVAAKAG